MCARAAHMTEAEREQALIRLMTDHKTALMRVAYLYLGEEGLAEDAVQETFIKAYTHLERFRGASSEKTWLTRILINTCKDVLRSAYYRQRTQSVPMDAAPEQGTEDHYRDDTVLQAVMNLPEKDRQVILLRYYQELTVPEMARVLRLPVPNVTSRLRRAKEHLQEALRGWYSDEE